MSSENKGRITTSFRGTDEGGKLKEVGTVYWTAPNTGATNSVVFTALPGGLRSMVADNFVTMGLEAYFWTSTSKSDIEAWISDLRYDLRTIDRLGMHEPVTLITLRRS